MKGIVFNVLEECVTAEHGADAWDDLLAEAGVAGAYTSLGSYPDAELHAIVTAAASAFGLVEHEVVRWLGRCAAPRFAERYPDLFAPFDSARSFALTLNHIIHPEVRKLYPGASVPEFDFRAPARDRLVLGYRSERRMCAFAEGLLEGAAAHYGERVAIHQPQCMHRGDPHCELDITFSRD